MVAKLQIVGMISYFLQCLVFGDFIHYILSSYTTKELNLLKGDSYNLGLKGRTTLLSAYVSPPDPCAGLTEHFSCDKRFLTLKGEAGC